MKLEKEETSKVFCCENCKVFFISYSKMDKPTHGKCKGHKTRLATNQEIDQINKKYKMTFCYNEV